MGNRYLFVIILSLFVFAISCKTKSDSPDTTKDSQLDDKKTEKEFQSKPIAMEKKVNIDKSELEKRLNKLKDEKMKNDLYGFAFDAFKIISRENTAENLSFSPVSLKLALALVYPGSENETLKEFSEVVGFSADKKSFSKTFETYYNYLASIQNDSLLDFNIANMAYIEQTYQILEEYKSDIKNIFQTSVEQKDFINNASGAEKDINDKVEKITKERISNLIPPGTLNNLTRMVLVNAIYVKSAWKHQFNESLTSEKDFYLNKDETVKIDFMRQTTHGIKYAENEAYKAIELEYKSENISLVLILPHESSINDIHSLVPDKESYLEIISELKPKEVRMEIPKFSIESSFNLNSLLMDMGLKSAFTSEADFSRISGNRDLEISSILQKVFFEIDEKGSEAAAATAVVMQITSVGPNIERPEPKQFIANRPFFFVLKENKLNTALFVGQYVGK